MNKIKKDDEVIVSVGKYKGKKAKVSSIDYSKGKVVVESVNVQKKHSKPKQNHPGGIVDKVGAINLSNVLVYCKKCKAGSKVKIEILKDNSKVRKCKKCAETI